MKKLIAFFMVLFGLMFAGMLSAQWSISTNHSGPNMCIITLTGTALTNTTANHVMTNFAISRGFFYGKQTAKACKARPQIWIFSMETNSSGAGEAEVQPMIYNLNVTNTTITNLKFKFKITGNAYTVRYRLFLLKPSAWVK